MRESPFPSRYFLFTLSATPMPTHTISWKYCIHQHLPALMILPSLNVFLSPLSWLVASFLQQVLLESLPLSYLIVRFHISRTRPVPLGTIPAVFWSFISLWLPALWACIRPFSSSGLSVVCGMWQSPVPVIISDDSGNESNHKPMN